MTTNDQAAMNEQLTQLRLQGLSIDGDNRYKQDLIDAVIGAMMFGAQGANPPPAGHWLEQFYVIGREERQALARVEAERDTAIVQMQNIRTNRDRLNKQLGDAEFNLCIAQQQLAEAVRLMREVEPHKVSEELETLFRAFLAQAEQQEAREPVLARPEHGVSMDEALALTMDRYSGAMEKLAIIEQQEAGHGHVTPRADGVVMKCGGPGLCAVCTAEQEAQGALAGDDRAAFEVWYRQEIDPHQLFRTDSQGVYLNSNCAAHFRTWMARAALAAEREAQGEQAGDEREAFEATLSPSLSRETFVDEEGDTIYCDTWVQGASIGWRRRAALATQPADERAREMGYRSAINALDDLDRYKMAMIPATAVPEATQQQLNDLHNFFNSVCEGGLHSVEKSGIQSLTELGALENCGFGKHRLTRFGTYLLDQPAVRGAEHE